MSNKLISKQVLDLLGQVVEKNNRRNILKAARRVLPDILLLEIDATEDKTSDRKLLMILYDIERVLSLMIRDIVNNTGHYHNMQLLQTLHDRLIVQYYKDRGRGTAVSSRLLSNFPVKQQDTLYSCSIDRTRSPWLRDDLFSKRDYTRMKKCPIKDRTRCPMKDYTRCPMKDKRYPLKSRRRMNSRNKITIWY